MINRKKMAISIPKEFFEKIEEIRKITHTTRSYIMTEAVKLWLKKQETEILENQYIKGYQKTPENYADLDPFFKAGLSSFGKEKW
ncbi:MAG: hypothetical protein ABIH00_00850 [Armatimonadota bacterium]